MPISINGSGTVTGVSVGGLPDGIVDTDMLATDAVTSTKIGANAFINVAYLVDEKGATTNGGSITSGGHIQRDLNTVVFDSGMSISISSNVFTLPNAGTYIINFGCPNYRTDQSVSRLRQVTPTDTSLAEGRAGVANSVDGGDRTESIGWHRITTTGSSSYRLMNRVQTSRSNNGLGNHSNSNSTKSQYSWVVIYQEA
tara:strand:+ start:329 stop:922 length:594 start_codon:yes stop_codon:yes gene_type:complete